jgi:hypothetical protein
LLATLKQAIKTTDKSMAGTLSIDNGLLVIETIDANKSNSKYSMLYKGSNTDLIPPVSVNIKFLADCLSGKGSGKIKFNALDKIESPIFITEGNTTTVLVPIKVNED